MKPLTHCIKTNGIEITVAHYLGREIEVLKASEIREDDKEDILEALKDSYVFNIGDGLAYCLPVHCVAFLDYDKKNTNPKEDAWQLTYYQHLETNERDVYQNPEKELERFTVEFFETRKKFEERACANSIFKVWGILEDLGVKQVKDCDTCLVYENSLVFFKGIDPTTENEALGIWYYSQSKSEVNTLLNSADFDDLNSCEDHIRRESSWVLNQCIMLKLTRDVKRRKMYKTASRILGELSTKPLPECVKDFVHKSFEELGL